MGIGGRGSLGIFIKLCNSPGQQYSAIYETEYLLHRLRAGPANFLPQKSVSKTSSHASRFSTIS
jgi:hypothetical protein